MDLINDVLDLSKIEAGRVDLYLERFDLDQMLDETAVTIQPLVSRNSNRLVTNFADNLGSVRADLTKVRQALTNLLSNAAKFTNEGTVTLAANREQRQGSDWIILVVSDTGIGIQPNKIDQIFDEFAQADDSITRNYGGTGLGLAISRRYCRMMGGDIFVESEVGTGSTFTIEIPAEVKILEVVKEIEIPEAKAVKSAPGSESKLLIIDDDTADRELMFKILQADGFDVEASASGVEGLELAHRLKPSLIILDLILSDIDGWVVLRNLKDDDETKDIPVVVVSSIGDSDLGYNLGAERSLTKPVDNYQLLQAVNHFIGPTDDGFTNFPEKDDTAG
ncbi:MAG: response regulator [Chloroflexota bacterium]|nr:MAG: response regulator [Chloroflexota bacterium]